MNLQEIKNLCEKATAGPWKRRGVHLAIIRPNNAGGKSYQAISGDFDTAADVEFCVTARTAVPILIRALDVAASEGLINNWLAQAERELEDANNK